MKFLAAVVATIGIVAPYVLALGLGIVGAHVWFASNIGGPMDPKSKTTIRYIVNPGANWKSIAYDLEEKGLLKNWWALYVIARLSDEEIQLYPGEYDLSAALSPVRIVKEFKNKDVVQYKITIPEGTRNADLAAIFSKAGLFTGEEIRLALSDPSLRREFDIVGSSLEGYVFPQTYQFTKPVNARDVISKMIQEGLKLKTNENVEKAIARGLTYYQAITLASIVEKETAAAKERPLIASVFLNRLNLNMPLGSDPTVIYGIQNFDGNLTKQHLQTPGPYNTYTAPGLPATPICNPGTAAIEAVLNPAQSEYLFFVAKGDGTHIFAKTYKQHKENVDKYQRGL